MGTAVPPRRYSQEELPGIFGVENPKIQRLFRSSHIKYRHLVLPEPGPLGLPEESIEDLNAKHREWTMKVGSEAIARCLEDTGLTVRDVDFLACVTSTGYLVPGLTARFIKELGFRDNVHRIDVVGMGCNAAVNTMQPAWSFCVANPGRTAMQVCVEICSAAYVHNESMETAVVNCLFGDAGAALLLRAGGPGEDAPAPLRAEMALPRILGFESMTVTDAIHTMRFDLDHGKLSFFLDRDIPYVIGANCGTPVGRLLERFGLRRRDISHWLVHSGGKKVIDSIKMNLDLTNHDVRHTLSVLENYGNISSCACLFSMERLAREGVVAPGDYGVLMAMGPGAAIETALLQW